MRVKCISRELTEEQRELLKAPSRFRPTHRFTVGKEYLVLGIISIIGSPDYGNTALLEIVNDHSQLVFPPAVLFEVTDARCSSYWRAAISGDGSLTLRPVELYREFFHDDLSEGDPATRQVFEEVVAKLEAEFSEADTEPSFQALG
jgi:hypothetical protein